MKLVLITGGSGFLGINLIRFLLSRDYHVRSLDIEPFTYPESDRIESVIGDIRDREAVQKCMNGVEAVIHCAAALPLYSKEDIFSTDVDGTRNVLQAAVDHDVRRVIHVSSTAVYGIPEKHPLYESDQLIGVGPYGEAKILAEKVCEEYRKKGLCISIIRPKSFVGPERLGVFALLYDWASSGKNFPLLGSGENKYQLLDVEDLCAALYLCLTKERDAINDVFNIGAKDFLTMREDFQSVLNVAGFRKKIISLPIKPILALLVCFEKLGISPLYQWVYGTAMKDSFVSIEKAEKILGYRPRYSNSDALRRNYEWYVAHKSTFSESGITHRVPWKQGILRVAKLFF
ncbi:MAG: NAD-dependent epimerase/dehydratase family protein [bacterium]|nr:NAD-dependent epimerase/dehydratase family protein [bacterium]